MDGLRILLLKFVIGHQHDCNGQIEQEEGADNDTSHEVKDDKERHCHIPEHVHDGRPALHRDALEDCHEGRANVVEIGHAVVQLEDVRVSVQIIHGKEISVCVVTLDEGATEADWTFTLTNVTQLKVIFDSQPVAIHRELSDAAAVVRETTPLRYSQNSEDGEEKDGESHDSSKGLHRTEQCLDKDLHGSDVIKRAKRPEQTESPHTRHTDDAFEERRNDDQEVEPVPCILQVGSLSNEKALSDDFKDAFNRESRCEIGIERVDLLVPSS